ncbi:nucleolar protein 4-like isoform X1 [Rhineura floridana]|uniref:nucleolar protein 4-like isoform X1 n=1 Tax=Rhineura floridana TaxID=261503 RepID=UPI002AC817E4|nr:nucleolar protein 4-like isoform X1 [Rhineura floridana]
MPKPPPPLLLRSASGSRPGDSELGRQFRDWCLRTYGDSAKTKTVTRSKYQRIAEVLQGGAGAGSGGEKGKFQFWVRSKGFRLGNGTRESPAAAAKMGQVVVYVPVKTGTGADGLSEPEGIALKRVAVVEDFFDIIYSMHVESSAEPGKAPKHAGQKKTYRAIAETYAFLPREAVTRFLMSCTECQKRMHFNSNGVEPKENEPPSSLVSGIIDYNMPLTSTYLKQMKLRVMNSQEQDETSVSSEDFDMNDSTWMSADQHLNSRLSPSQEEGMRSPQNIHSQEDDDSSSESCSGNGSSTLNPSTSSSTQGDPAYPEMNGNGAAAPMDFSASSEDQPINLCDKLAPAHITPSYQSDSCSADGLRSRAKYGAKSTAESPPYSSGSYDSVKTEVSGCPEDLTVGRAPAADDDDDDHEDHEDNDKMNDSEGMDPERLKAFNMFVRLFVDENLDRMVPISKQPKEKIQAIIESCSRQFPEFQERARKRIRTYLKSCRRMKKNGMEMTRPTPPHLTSAMAENILAAACESETRKAAKRMRLEIYQTSQDEPVAQDKQHSRDSAAITHSSYTLPASSFSQDPVYINGSLNYSYRSYGNLGGSLQPAASLQTANHSNGPTDLSMKSGASSTTPPANSTNRGVPAAQLSPTEISAVRQLIAGYRESAAFLLRSADELENLILQQN